jgi:hypothetical protein
MNDDNDHDNLKRCLLCNGELLYQFHLKILAKYDGNYYRCKVCESLQLVDVDWLDEAYSTNLSSLDTEAAQRNLKNFAAVYVIATIFKFLNIVDIGGGDGFLCRLLRDYEYNCYVFDRYCAPTYAQGFSSPNFESPHIATLFEVIEHFSEPNYEFFKIFNMQPNIVLLTTGIYFNQGKDWFYYAPESGQHIFFYSPKAFKIVAERFGYDLLFASGYVIFFKENLRVGIKKFLLKFLFKGKILRIILALLMLKSTPGLWKDYLVVRNGN